MNRILFLLLAAFLFKRSPTRAASASIPATPARISLPTLVPDTTTYRNLALHRPAYQSSAYDYNLTASW